MMNNSRIIEIMNIHRFINSIEEMIMNTDADIVKKIVSRFIESERVRKTDEEIENISIVEVNETMKKLRLIRLHEKQKKNDDVEFLRLLRLHEKRLLNRCQRDQKQQSLDA